MLDMTGAEIRIPQKPSEVFLRAIQALAIADPEMPGTEFKEYAEAWRQICHLEELYAAAEWKIRWENLLAEPVTVTAERSDQDHGGPSGTVTYDCSSAPMPDADEAKKARSDSARAAAINRKRNLLEKLDGLRASGTTLAAIAGADHGLTITDVMDALARKPLALMKQQALERAVKKLEEAELSGGD